MQTSLRTAPVLSFAEEVANSVSHGVMALLLLLSLPAVSVYAYHAYGLLGAWGVAVFCIGILLMFLSSALYHAMAPGSAHKSVLQVLDHSCIYVAIAGSYTPIALSVIGGWKGYLVVGLQWGMVIAGVLYKSLAKGKRSRLSLLLYLGMGWVAVFFMPTLLQNANAVLLGCILAGGVAYSVGAFFYTRRSLSFHHFIWHLFVIAGAGCHFAGIVFFLK